MQIVKKKLNLNHLCVLLVSKLNKEKIGRKINQITKVINNQITTIKINKKT